MKEGEKKGKKIWCVGALERLEVMDCAGVCDSVRRWHYLIEYNKIQNEC